MGEFDIVTCEGTLVMISFYVCVANYGCTGVHFIVK